MHTLNFVTNSGHRTSAMAEVDLEVVDSAAGDLVVVDSVAEDLAGDLVVVDSVAEDLVEDLVEDLEVDLEVGLGGGLGAGFETRRHLFGGGGGQHDR